MSSSEPWPGTESATYDGFVSYSHAADGLFAPRLQSGLQRFAKPWWKRRALRVFRDESSLSANPHLWSSITQALDDSSWFVLLLSPDAAASPWVNQEIEYWKTHRDPQRILPVLTGGTFEWEGGDMAGTAVPDQLRGAFPEEPRWVDARFAKTEDQLDLKNPNFADAVADIASALRGVPKDDLASEEVRQHRRTVRTAWAAAILVLLLGAAASVAAVMASRNAQEAERQAAIAEVNAAEAETQRDAAVAAEEEAQHQARLARMRELGAASVEVLDSDPRLARILAVEAVDTSEAYDEIPTTVVNALWRSLLDDRLVREIDTGLPGFTPIVLSENGGTLVLGSDEGSTVRVYSVPDGEELWSQSWSGSPEIGVPSVSPDGSLVAVGIWDMEAPEADGGGKTRIEILDGKSGALVATLEYPECSTLEPWGWTNDGALFALNHGIEPCPRDSALGGIWVEVLDANTWDSIAVIETQDPWVAEPLFDESGLLYVFGIETPAAVYDNVNYEQLDVYEGAIGLGDVSPDGSLLAVFSPGTGVPLQVFDTATGLAIDNLDPMDGIPVYGFGIRFSSDSSRLVVGTEGNETYIWDVPSGRQTTVLPSGPSSGAIMTPDGGMIITSHPGGIVRFWDLGPRTVNTHTAGDLGSYTWVNANTFSVGSELGGFQAIDLAGDCIPFCSQVRLFDVATGELKEDQIEGVGAAALPDGRFAVSSADSQVFVYDPATRTSDILMDCLRDEAGRCNGPGDSFIDGVLVSVENEEVGLTRREADGSETLLVVDVDSGDIIEETSTQELISEFSAEWVLTNTRDEYIVVERGTGEELARLGLSGDRWELSSSKRLAAIFSYTGSLNLLELGTWEISEFEIEVGQVRGMGFSPDDQLIALGDESSIYIFDFGLGIVTQSIPIPGVSDINWLDEQTIVIGTNYGLWATVSLNIEDLVEAARQPAVPREFTAQECVTYRIDPCPTQDVTESP